MAPKNAYFSWIEGCLQYGGRFGPFEKAVYCQRFGVSEPSASRHQAEFAEIYEASCNVTFARSAEGRLRGGKLVPETELPKTPVFSEMPSLERWLEDCFGGARFFNVEIPRRDPEPWILRAIIQSMRSKSPVLIDYHSRTGDSRRIVSPHALVKIVGRIHMRAFDHSRNDFADFVLSRVTAATLNEQMPFIGNEHDKAWQRFETVVVQAANSTDGAARGVQLDFGLDEAGERRIRVRQPFVQYLIIDMDEGYTAPVRVDRAK